jgi:hypothetical protein
VFLVMQVKRSWTVLAQAMRRLKRKVTVLKLVSQLGFSFISFLFSFSSYSLAACYSN